MYPHVEELLKIVVPQKYLVFVWLAFHNKIPTRDNLSKRQVIDDMACLFSSENEYVFHPFIDCLVAKEVWSIIAEIFELHFPCNMCELDAMWGVDNKKLVINTVCVAVIWSLLTI